MLVPGISFEETATTDKSPFPPIHASHPCTIQSSPYLFHSLILQHSILALSRGLCSHTCRIYSTLIYLCYLILTHSLQMPSQGGAFHHLHSTVWILNIWFLFHISLVYTTIGAINLFKVVFFLTSVLTILPHHDIYIHQLLPLTVHSTLSYATFDSWFLLYIDQLLFFLLKNHNLIYAVINICPFMLVFCLLMWSDFDIYIPCALRFVNCNIHKKFPIYHKNEDQIHLYIKSIRIL